MKGVMMDPVTSPTTSGSSLRQIREDAGTQLGDLMVLEATADSEARTVFIDGVNLIDEPRYYMRRQFVPTTGTIENQGAVRHVIDSSQTNSSITINAALPERPRLGDQAHLMNWRGVGFTYHDYKQAINTSILDLIQSHYEIPVSFEASENLNADNTITIPANWVSIESLEYYDQFDGWTQVYATEGGPGGGWEVDTYRNTIRLSNRLVYRLREAGMRINGLADPFPLENEGDITTVPHEWVVTEVCARLLESSLARNPGVGERARLLNLYRERANSIRPLGLTRTGPFSVRLR